jgi:hypothetical protein
MIQNYRGFYPFKNTSDDVLAVWFETPQVWDLLLQNIPEGEDFQFICCKA